MNIPEIKTQNVHPKVTDIEWLDGTKGTLIGSNTIKTRNELYLKNVKPVSIPSNPMPTSPSDVLEVGSGSGSLILSDVFDKTIKIKPGTYDYLDFRNFKHFKVIGEGVKLLNGSGIMGMRDGEISGLSVVNSKYRAFNISGINKDFIMQNITLKNIGDVAINLNDETQYNGDVNSFSENIQLLNFDCDNIGMFLGARGTIANGSIQGLVKRFKMSGCKITNAPKMGNGVYMGCVEDYEISNNIIDNVNSEQNDHNGIFHMVGNGRAFGNKLTNHQGNMIRAWICSLTKDGEVEIFDNIVYNSRRYGAFELQTPPWMIQAKVFTAGKKAKIYNNTVGKLNTADPKYFEGRLLDLYTSHCEVEVFNNLLFDNRDPEIINNMSDRSNTKIIRSENNVYKSKSTEAVNDLINFKSMIGGIGAR